MKPHRKLDLRNNAKKIGSMEMTRHVHAETGGMLVQEIVYMDKKEPLSRTVRDAFQTHDSLDPDLQTLDRHWKLMTSELEDINEQAAYYHYIKKGDDSRTAMDNFCKDTLNILSDHMLRHDLSAELADGNIDKDNYPLTTDSYRLSAMRGLAQNSGITLDHFEKAIEALAQCACQAIDQIDHALTNGEDEEFGPGHDWKSSVDEYDQLSDAEQRALEVWEKDEHDAFFDEYAEYMNELDDYMNNVAAFTDTANHLWMNAAARIKEGRPARPEKEKIASMQHIMEDTQEAYGRLKACAQDSGIARPELAPVYDMLEDPEKGVLTRMQKIISVAKQPILLENTIKKSLAKEHEK